MSLSVSLNGIAPYNPESSYQTLEKLMDEAYTEISFWGTRNVYVIGYEGSISMKDLVRKVRKLIQSHDPNPGMEEGKAFLKGYEDVPEKMTKNFKEKDRETGKRITKKFNALLKISMDQQEKANWITQIFMACRTFFLTYGGIGCDPIYDFPYY